MAGKYGLTGTLATAANTANQIIWGVVSGAADADGTMTWVDVTFDSGTAAQGIRVELFRATGGTPTNYAYTINKLGADSQTVSGMTAAYVCSGSNPVAATPTGLVVIKTWHIGPTGGLAIQYPLGREDYMVAGTTAWIGCRISTPSGVNPNCAYNADWAE